MLIFNIYRIAGICKVDNPDGISLRPLGRVEAAWSVSNVAGMVKAGL